MKKTLLSLSLLASSLLFGAEATYTEFMNSAIQDSYELHNYSKAEMGTMLHSDAALKKYTNKLDAYEEKVSTFLEEQAKENFASKEDAKVALEELEKLSTQNVVLAKTVAYLASHQADNADKSYNSTIQAASKTILRLSDDIGVMSDRILLMAKEIGVMADRIVKTQEIQSANMLATQKLAKYAMALTDQEITTTRQKMQHRINSDMSNMHLNQMQIQQVQSAPQQGTIQMH
jgi:hypothetical protein